MQVKFRTNLGSTDAETLGVNFRECVVDAVVAVADDVGARLCNMGFAVDVTPKSAAAPPVEKLKAVPAEPEIESSAVTGKKK